MGLLAVPVLALTLTACGGGAPSAEAPKAAETTKAAAPAATTAAPAAAAAEKPAALALVVDTVWGSKGMTDAEKPLKSCVQTSRVKPGETFGWRIKVIDTATGKALDDKAIEPGSVTITVPGATVPAIKFGEHGGKPPTDAFWSTWWTVPDNQPTGVLAWTISVKTKDGRTAELKHDTFNVKSAWLTVMPKS
ncbi:MAG: hypothetical protein AB7G21_11960 [Dehalococcoidia bacterium]